MKHQADKNHSKRQFQVGDWVFLKLQPYIQSSLAPRANQKLSFKYFGPFEITQRVGQVAYKLRLPKSSHIHPVFHISLLKKVVGQDVSVSSSLPRGLTEYQVPEKVLQRRVTFKGARSVPQALIKWTESSECQCLATWEDVEPLKQRFPAALAWGQAGFQGGKNVRATLHKRMKSSVLEGNEEMVQGRMGRVENREWAGVGGL
jgi:hypothetical protein